MVLIKYILINIIYLFTLFNNMNINLIFTLRPKRVVCGHGLAYKNYLFWFPLKPL